jgi:hypothetical protein
MVYMPVGLIRTTDFSFALRNLLQRRAVHLYGGFCNLLPPRLAVKSNESDKWALEAFNWSDPVGTMDNMEAFHHFRSEELREMLAAA